MTKVVFDRIVAFTALLLLAPLFIVVAVAIAIDSRGGVFFIQQRVGRHGKLFGIWKFRTMRPLSEKGGTLTIGHRDPRITRIGYMLRKYKLDELPQLINVFKGDMSLVGPRPEVPEYVAHYQVAQRRVLEVRPGVTDYASLHYFHESELLAQSADPKRTYIEEVLPHKLALNLDYLERRSFGEDLRIIALTVRRIFSA